ncbi:MAG TPA: class I SAM-dependent methyltransferase [Candidatus Binatia bacterium]|jgi:predicted O-methyltransferase YrrM
MKRDEANVRFRRLRAIIKSITMTGLLFAMACPTAGVADAQLDARVEKFLEQRRGTWRDLNVPYEDGKILHDLIVERKFTRALEIGTSTGHSTIWIAWALSKTGGKLTTVEIDPARHEQAKANVTAAGLSQHVEFILGDAHKIVPAARGRYDFVFSDADKDWYIHYFDAMYPKLTHNACFTAHNVEESRFGLTRGWVRRYLEHVRGLPDMQTSIHPNSRAGVAITCKKTA